MDFALGVLVGVILGAAVLRPVLDKTKENIWSTTTTTVNGRPATPEEAQRINAAFAKADEAFKKADEAFDKADEAFKNI